MYQRILPLYICFVTLLASCFAFGQSRTSEKLVPAQTSPKTDGSGYRWDVNPTYGYIQYGQNNTFSSAARLYVNGSSFRATSPLMTADGSEYVLKGAVSTLQITRRIKIDTKESAARFVDIYTNNSSNPVQVSARIQTQLGQRPATMVTSETRQNVLTSLGEKDGGILILSPQTGSSSQLSVLIDMSGPRSKIKPIIKNESNYQFYYTYNFSVPPKKSAAIIHGLAQRSLATIPDAKGMATLFKPFRSRSWTRSLPASVRSSIVNGGGMRFGDWAAVNALAALEELNVERGAFDILAVSDKTRLRGNATCASVTVATNYGELKMKWDEVAAVIGGAGPGANKAIMMRNGQVLHGDLVFEDLSFMMSSGVSIDLNSDKLDRLVTKESPTDGQPPPGVFAVLQTVQGERLALAKNESHLLNVITPWGERAISWDNITRLESSKEQLGFRIGLQDGTRLFGYLVDSTLEVNTLSFGAKSFSVGDVQSVVPAAKSQSDEFAEVAVPHVILAGENMLIGQVDLSELNFIARGQTIPVPTSQIRVLRNTTEEFDGPPLGAAAAFFEAELWDGGILIGRLAERIIPVRNGDQVLQVRARDIVEVHRPTPTVPESLRRSIAQHVRDLGSDEYERREKATEALLTLGLMAKQQLNDALAQAPDAEVRRRLERLLNEISD